MCPSLPPTSFLGALAEVPHVLTIPFEILDMLLRHQPERAAAFLAQLPISAFLAHLAAHAEACDVPLSCIVQEWRELYAHLRLQPSLPPDDPTCASVYEPGSLADLLADDPVQARRLLAALRPSQRVTQAIAQAAWLARYGLLIRHQEILAAWEAPTSL